MGVLIGRPQPLWRLRVEVDFDLTPQEAFDFLPNSNPDIANWPEDQMVKWNGGRTGVETVDFWVLWTKESFNEVCGRQMLETAGLDPILPVMLASLARPQNDPNQMRKELNEDEGMWGMVILSENDEDLLQLHGSPWAFYLCLFPGFFQFYLNDPRGYWGDHCALPGLLQVPKALGNLDS